MEKTLRAKEESDLNKALYIIKTFAVISIVLAHTCYDVTMNEYIKSFLSIYKGIGIYIFFILSGYFFHIKKYKNIKELLKDKFIKIGIPWVILGTVSFIIVSIFSKSIIDILAFVNFVLGNGTYLYYLTILIMCYIITYFLPQKRNIYLYILILVNIASVLLTSMNVFPKIVYDRRIIFSYLNPYLNIMNWIGIFSTGVLIKRKNLLEKYEYQMKKWGWILVIFYSILYIILCLLKINISYWNLLSIVIGIVSFFVFTIISLKLININILIDIGKKSFFIYQIHLLFVGLIFNNILRDSSIFAIIRPVITVIVIYFVAVVGKKIAKILKLDKIYDTLLGIR